MMVNADVPAIIETYDGGTQAIHPSVVKFGHRWNGYEYWMAYTPYTNTNERVGNPSIAVSNDGENWTKPRWLRNPLDKPENYGINVNGHFSDTELIHRDGLEIFYRYRLRGWGERIFRKKSKDGLTWTDREIVYQIKNPSGEEMLSPTLIFEDNLYKMWYVGRGGSVYFVFSKTGNRGTWSKPQRVYFSYIDEGLKPWHISVFKEGHRYYILLNAIKDGDSKNRVLAIGTGIQETKFNQVQTVLTSKNNNNWDNRYIYRSCIIREDDGNYKLYYSAKGKDRKWGIGILNGKDKYNLK